MGMLMHGSSAESKAICGVKVVNDGSEVSAEKDQK